MEQRCSEQGRHGALGGLFFVLTAGFTAKGEQ